nr:hypothetical protein Iba_chr02aCG14910 [Ipomoea batatas]GMC63379.1 hypothetical protein Iba_chr02cCG12800 [Ipomoea batatas]GMD12825.1 hypothetical protein Iba_scaffold40498CG0010 [Ipomoea batatas]
MWARILKAVYETDICVHQIVVHIVKTTQGYTTIREKYKLLIVKIFKGIGQKPSLCINH